MNNISQFSFLLSTKIEFGVGKSKNICKYIKELNGKKVMIVTDKVLLKLGIVDPIISSLKENNVSYIVFDEVEPDPKCELIDRASKLCRESSVDLIIAVGGGSSIDSAKGISVVASNGNSSYDYLDGRGEEKKEILKQPIPIIAIPTTSGTGSEVSQYSVITNNKIKDSISSELIYPKIAVIDASFMEKLPSKVTAYTGLDVLGHAIESYISNIENKFTDLLALEAIKLVFENLKQCVNNPTIEGRNNMAFAAMLAGTSMSHCGAALAHAMGCPLSGHCNVPHGLSVGLLQIPTIVNNKDKSKDKFKEILNYIDSSTKGISPEESVEMLINKIRDLLKDINVEEVIKLENVTDETIDNMTEDAINHGCSTLNPQKNDKEAIKKIYMNLIKAY
ncbi:iron-containing alcohol dehydrogenase [Clostridium oceanicum]|uniref:Choline dehydrogenase n=1 Tax=Clostridium oceanicum TaxID=1543 RepID=A0ABN1JLX4_9CLOT